MTLTEVQTLHGILTSLAIDHSSNNNPVDVNESGELSIVRKPDVDSRFPEEGEREGTQNNAFYFNPDVNRILLEGEFN